MVKRMVVFEIRDQKPLPAEPKPIPRQVAPTTASGRIAPIDRLLRRREWEREKESGRRQASPHLEALAERSIQQLVGQINDHLASRGITLRLVLVKNGEEYGLDIYDLTEENVCRAVADVRLEIRELPALLRHLQAETGILVDTRM